MDHKIKIILGNILLLGSFAFLAMSSASTSEERNENIDTIRNGWNLGRDIYKDVHSNNISPKKGSLDSIAATSANDIAVK